MIPRHVFLQGLTVLLLLPGLAFSSARTSKSSLKIGMTEFVPLVVFDRKKPGGLIYDYAREVLESPGLPLQYEESTVNRSIEQLRTGHLDVILALFKTPERAVQVRFSQEPLFALTYGFCARVSIQQKPLTRDTRLAFARGTLVPPEFGGFSLMPVSGEKVQIRMLQMLAKGRVDAVQSPMPEVLILAAHEAGIHVPQACYSLKNEPWPVHIAFSPMLPLPIVQRIEESLQKKLHEENFEHFAKRRFAEAGISQPAVQPLDRNQLPPLP